MVQIRLLKHLATNTIIKDQCSYTCYVATSTCHWNLYLHIRLLQCGMWQQAWIHADNHAYRPREYTIKTIPAKYMQIHPQICVYLWNNVFASIVTYWCWGLLHTNWANYGNGMGIACTDLGSGCGYSRWGRIMWSVLWFFNEQLGRKSTNPEEEKVIEVIALLTCTYLTGND